MTLCLGWDRCCVIALPKKIYGTSKGIPTNVIEHTRSVWPCLKTVHTIPWGFSNKLFQKVLGTQKYFKLLKSAEIITLRCSLSQGCSFSRLLKHYRFNIFCNLKKICFPQTCCFLQKSVFVKTRLKVFLKTVRKTVLNPFETRAAWDACFKFKFPSTDVSRVFSACERDKAVSLVLIFFKQRAPRLFHGFQVKTLSACFQHVSAWFKQVRTCFHAMWCTTGPTLKKSSVQVF